ncbi:MAG: alpha/beta fold hydrolase [Lachnospiraceae bacterium]|nr:alpha/beta fold hydrolase [Lachnospiraceae bacterium]
MDLKTAFQDLFKIGVALSRRNLETEANRKLVCSQFSSFTAENDMKPMFFLDPDNRLEPEKYDTAPKLDFQFAIPFLEFAKKSGIPMRGHTLVWHNQTPEWFFRENYDEFAPLVSREKMLSRMENYIKGVLTFVQENYPGVIYCWDVVNEAIDEGDFRKSRWTETVGTDFVEKAFTFARKYAAEEVKLFYNDYNCYEEWKRDLIIEKILKPLKEKGIVDGFGMQSHFVMDFPGMDLFKEALYRYGALGIEVQLTELDIHNADPSEESMQALADRYADLFRLLVETKKNGKADITAVTFWNLRDNDSWLTGFRKETSYPLLFDGDSRPKKSYYSVLKTVVDEAQIDELHNEYTEEELQANVPHSYRRAYAKLNTHFVEVEPGVKLAYEEYGWGDNYIFSAQMGFYPLGMQWPVASKGYHLICITLRGFAPSSYVTEDYGDQWYDVFAKDVIRVADKMKVDKFFYMGASHGAGVGWHLCLNHPERVKGFVAMVPGPHSLEEGTMSLRQMALSGALKEIPPMDPPIDNDPARVRRREFRENHIAQNPEPDPREKAIDYGRPLLKYKTEEKLREALHTIQTPTLILGAVDDPISTPELMLRTAKELPHCKLVMYSNTGHNIDTDLVEELTFETDHFLKQVDKDGRVYETVK